MNKEDKKRVLINFREELEKFTTDVNELTKNSELPTKNEFLKKVANDVNQLYTSSINVQKEASDEVEEIGAVIQNLFVQPLSVKHHAPITILKAVEAFDGEKGEESDLSYIMREYVNHPESTKSFIRELELLTEDLDDILKKIA